MVGMVIVAICLFAVSTSFNYLFITPGYIVRTVWFRENTLFKTHTRARDLIKIPLNDVYFWNIYSSKWNSTLYYLMINRGVII